ncbi:ubiquitin-conjugating enzyme E2 [Streptomyces sp. 2MCAF27]
MRRTHVAAAHADVLKTWSSAVTTDQVLVSLMSLLAEPNLGDVLNDDAARLYEEDREAYATKVREAVRRTG